LVYDEVHDVVAVAQGERECLQPNRLEHVVNGERFIGDAAVDFRSDSHFGRTASYEPGRGRSFDVALYVPRSEVITIEIALSEWAYRSPKGYRATGEPDWFVPGDRKTET
jgi:hypothetical protein